MSRERARTSGIGELFQMVAPQLEAHLRRSGAERARQRSAWLPRLDEGLPEEGAGATETIELLRLVAEHGLPLGDESFCGWITTSGPVVPLLSQLVASTAAAQKWWTHPGGFLDHLAGRWLIELLGLDPAGVLSFTSGGSVANLLGLSAARQRFGSRHGVDVAADGVSALPAARVYCSDQVHHVVLRSLGVLGLGRSSLRRVPTDRGARLEARALREAIIEDEAHGLRAVAIVASAGDVNTGAIDPIGDIIEIARERDIWLHVDGAYGGFGVLDQRVRPLYADLRAYDSFAVDPHKWLGVPVGCGAAYVRDPRFLADSLALGPAHYVDYNRQTGSDPESCFADFGPASPDHSLDHSAPARGLWVWAALKEIGANGMRERVARHLDCAQRVAQRARTEPELELLADPVLSICCFRYHPPEIRDSGELERLNRAIIARAQARGRSVPSATRVNNKLAIRPCFIGANSGVDSADALVDEVLTLGRSLAGTRSP